MIKVTADFWLTVAITVWKVSKCGVISGPYFAVYSPYTGNYGPEITPYLDTFHIVYNYPIYPQENAKSS